MKERTDDVSETPRRPPVDAPSPGNPGKPPERGEAAADQSSQTDRASAAGNPGKPPERGDGAADRSSQPDRASAADNPGKPPGRAEAGPEESKVRTGEGRGKNKFRPDPAAEGSSHTRFRGDKGGVTHYQTYGEDGTGVRVDVTGSPHNGVPTPHAVDTTRHENPTDPGKSRWMEGRTARPAEPEEIPKRR